MTIICGIEEAGRGPVIGPMVMAGVTIEEEDESKLISYSLKVDKFALADILDEFGWKPQKAAEILDYLTSLGILRHSKSYVYGDQWYIISEQSE